MVPTEGVRVLPHLPHPRRPRRISPASLRIGCIIVYYGWVVVFVFSVSWTRDTDLDLLCWLRAVAGSSTVFCPCFAGGCILGLRFLLTVLPTTASWGQRFLLQIRGIAHWRGCLTMGRRVPLSGGLCGCRLGGEVGERAIPLYSPSAISSQQECLPPLLSSLHHVQVQWLRMTMDFFMKHSDLHLRSWSPDQSALLIL